MIIKSIIKKETYIDSMSLMALSTKVNKLPLVEKAMIGMGTDMNKQVISDVGLMTSEIKSANRGDLIIVFMVKNKEDIDTVLQEIADLQKNDDQAEKSEHSYHSLAKALKEKQDSNLVLFSIPGEYIFQEAKDALLQDRHVMLFSDNVSIEEELSLKKLAIERNLLMMGPDCGTAIINGAGLCFANKVTRGSIGIVAASGTGSQEVSVQIDRLGGGISQLIGVGGRDLSEDINGIMMEHAINMLDKDPQTKVITLISKPPAKSVESKIITLAKTLSKPVVICFIGSKEPLDSPQLTIVPNTLLAAQKAVEIAYGSSIKPQKTTIDINTLKAALQPSQKNLRGLFAGGTVCDEVYYALIDAVPVISNVAGPKDQRHQFGTPLKGNAVIDFGDDDYTQGRAHPMIDSTFRSQAIIEQANDPSVAAIMLDFELGFGANEDPVGSMLPDIQKAQKIAADAGRKLLFIAYLLGTDLDHQNKRNQEKALKDAGVIVVDSVAELGQISSSISQMISH